MPVYLFDCGTCALLSSHSCLD